MCRLLLFATVGLIACAAGCASPVALPLADGTTQTFAFKGNMPLPTESDWAEVLYAGAVVEIRDHEARWRWQCILKMHEEQVASVVVYDVTREMKLLLRDDSPKFKDGHWIGSSQYETVDSAPWLTGGEWNLFVLRFDLMSAAGETRRVYQPTVFSEAVDKRIEDLRTR